jgi:SAM-dependent methyltransferase
MHFHDAERARQHQDLMKRLVREMHERFIWEPVHCVMCGTHGDLSLAFEKWGVAMSICNRCNHLFVNPRMATEAVPFLYGSTYWDNYTRAIGSPTIGERVVFDYQNGEGKLRRDVLPFRQSGRLLDVGASNGGMVRRARELGFDAAGLEPSPEICELARNTHRVTMYCGSLAEQEFPEDSFDIVTLHDVLEHFFDPRQELLQIRRIMPQGGLLVVETPTTDSRDFAEMGIDWPSCSPLEHVHLFSAANGARLLQETGFRIIDLYCPHENNWIAIAEAA